MQGLCETVKQSRWIHKWSQVDGSLFHFQELILGFMLVFRCFVPTGFVWTVWIPALQHRDANLEVWRQETQRKARWVIRQSSTCSIRTEHSNHWIDIGSIFYLGRFSKKTWPAVSFHSKDNPLLFVPWSNDIVMWKTWVFGCEIGGILLASRFSVCRFKQLLAWPAWLSCCWWSSWTTSNERNPMNRTFLYDMVSWILKIHKNTNLPRFQT